MVHPLSPQMRRISTTIFLIHLGKLIWHNLLKHPRKQVKTAQAALQNHLFKQIPQGVI